MALPGLHLLALKAFGAALDDALWQSWSEDMIAAFDADGGALWLLDTRSHDFCRSYFCVPGETGEGGESDCAIVASTKVALSLAGCSFALPCSARSATPTDADGEPFCAGISLYKSDPDEAEWEEKRRVLEAVFPDIVLAFRLASAHEQRIADAWWRGATADEPRATLLVGRGRELLDVSPEAGALIERGDLVRVEDGVVSVIDAGSDAAFAAALDRVGRDGSYGAVGVPLRRRNARPVRALLYPCAADGSRLARPFAAALVRLIDPARRRSSLAEGEALFGLTRRECEVANLMIAGHSVESASQVMSVSRNTTRNHLQALFRKTETNRQSDLVRVLLGAA